MSEKGEYGGGYDKSDASKDTGDSASKVSEAWHDARDKAAEEGGWGVPKDRHGDSSSDSGK
jgi:hypothetical protein